MLRFRQNEYLYSDNPRWLPFLQVRSLVGIASLTDEGVPWALAEAVDGNQSIANLRRDLELRFPSTDFSPILGHGRWDDQPHQFLPAHRLLTSDWGGVLVADEVGLGKTISALVALRTLHAMGGQGGGTNGLRIPEGSQGIFRKVNASCEQTL